MVLIFPNILAFNLSGASDSVLVTNVCMFIKNESCLTKEEDTCFWRVGISTYDRAVFLKNVMSLQIFQSAIAGHCHSHHSECPRQHLPVGSGDTQASAVSLGLRLPGEGLALGLTLRECHGVQTLKILWKLNLKFKKEKVQQEGNLHLFRSIYLQKGFGFPLCPVTGLVAGGESCLFLLRCASETLIIVSEILCRLCAVIIHNRTLCHAPPAGSSGMPAC